LFPQNPRNPINPQRAEQSVTQSDHLFQTMTADVEANAHVREPQQGAHRAVRTHFVFE
jgi:DNA repair protein RadD